MKELAGLQDVSPTLADKLYELANRFVEQLDAAYAALEKADLSHAAKEMQELKLTRDELDGLAKAFVRGVKAERKSAAETDAGVDFSTRYYYPRLSPKEWDKLNQVMAIEISSPQKYLDEETKWLYSKSGNVTVFALYGIGDGTEPTPLYATGGSSADSDYFKFIAYKRELDKSDGKKLDGRRETVNRWFEAISVAKRKYYADNATDGHRRKTMGLDRILNELTRRNGAGNSESSASNISGIDSALSDRVSPEMDAEYLELAKEPEQVKSADPVTYDNNRNVIPLSQRFNPEEDDIRFSDRVEVEPTEAQQSLIQDMRDKYGNDIPEEQLLEMGLREQEKAEDAAAVADAVEKIDETLTNVERIINKPKRDARNEKLRAALKASRQETKRAEQFGKGPVQSREYFARQEERAKAKRQVKQATEEERRSFNDALFKHDLASYDPTRSAGAAAAEVKRNQDKALRNAEVGQACLLRRGRHMCVHGLDTLYLLTDLTGFYKRCGWSFPCPVQGDGEDSPSRTYVHRSPIA